MKHLNETIQKIQKILMERNDNDVCVFKFFFFKPMNKNSEQGI